MGNEMKLMIEVWADYFGMTIIIHEIIYFIVTFILYLVMTFAFANANKLPLK